MNGSLRVRLPETVGGALLLFAFISPPVEAGWQLTALPFSNAQVAAMAAAPSASGRVYIGTMGTGFFRTDDRGAHWTHVNGGIPPDASISCIVVSPVDGDRAWAALYAPSIPPGLVWRTTNGGANWTSFLAIPGSWINDLLVVSSNPTVLLASHPFATGEAVYRSTDEGETWAPAGVGFTESVRDLDSRAADPAVILAATLNGVARSTDSGSTWASGNPGQEFKQVVMAASDPNRVYAVANVYKDPLLESTNGGISFTSVNPPSSFEFTDRIAVHPFFPDELMAAGSGYGCAGLGYFAAVAKSTNGGDSWSIGYSECPRQPATGLSYDPTSAQHVYMGQPSGFWHSAQGGAQSTWVRKVDGISNYQVGTVEGDLDGGNYINGSSSLYRSIGDLSAWDHVSSTIGGWSHRFEVNFTDPNRMFDVGEYIYAGDIVYPFFHQSTDGGSSWSTVGGLPAGIPDYTFFSGAHSNHGDGSVVYAIANGGELYRSGNGGQSYALVHSGPPQLRELVVDPLDPNRIFVAAFGTPRVHLSTDGGVSFEPRESGLPVGAVSALFMRRADPEYLIAVVGSRDVWETFDAGMSWSLRFDLAAGSFNDVDWDEASGHVFFSTWTEGVVTSHPLYDPAGLPTNAVLTVHWDPAQSTLLAGTSSAGLWQQTIASPVDAPLVVDAAALAIKVAPNPAREATTLHFAVPNGGAQVTADVFDASGRRIRRLVDAALPAGDRRLVWDGAADNGERASAGVYFVRVRAGGEESTARIVRLR